MSEYRVCVTSGHRAPSYTSCYEAEAIVYTFGGQVVARFYARTPGNLPKRGGTFWSAAQSVRAQARLKAEEWVAAHAA